MQVPFRPTKQTRSTAARVTLEKTAERLYKRAVKRAAFSAYCFLCLSFLLSFLPTRPAPSLKLFTHPIVHNPLHSFSTGKECGACLIAHKQGWAAQTPVQTWCKPLLKQAAGFPISKEPMVRKFKPTLPNPAHEGGARESFRAIVVEHTTLAVQP